VQLEAIIQPYQTWN